MSTLKPSSQLPQDLHNDEISLWDIFESLRERWKTILAFTAAGTVAALTLGLVIPKQFEATAIIQVAKIGSLQAALSGEGSLSTAVESIPSSLQRLQSDAFLRRVSSELGSPVSIKATEPKGSSLIEVNLRAATPKAAEQGATLVVSQLSQVHAKAVQDTAQALRQSLETTKAEAAQIQALIKSLSGKPAQFSQGDGSSSLLMGQAQGQLMNQLNTLIERRIRLELALSPLYTSETKAIEAIFSSEEPVVPNLRLTIVLGFLAGLFLGTLAALIAKAWTNRQSYNLSTNSGTA
jgi:capsular polysaccharide biosynthesis protein